MTVFRRTILLFCAIAAAFPGFSQTNAEQVMNIGRNVMAMEDYMLAIQYFNQSIKAKPYLSDPYFYRAIAKLSLDDFKGAADDCTLAIERNKFKTEAYKVRGFARQNLGQDSLAIADYNIGLEYNPTDKYFLFYKAVAQSELKDYAGAGTTFSALLRQYPNFEEGYTARGRLNVLKGDTVAALADVDRAIELSQSLVNPYLLRAEIEWKRKEWNKASQDIGAAIRLHPDVADLYVNRAFIRYNSDDFFGAMSDYNYALELEPANTSALFNRALLRYEVKDLEKAETDLTSVLSIDADNFHALYNRGLVRLENGKNKDAYGDFERIAGKYPRFYPVYYAMAEAKRNSGDMRAAVRLARHADELVEKYIGNPEKNPLDRPAIAGAESNDARDAVSEESESEVMEKFNRLVTVSNAVETQLSYNEKIKGRVQDRNLQVEPEPIYLLSFIAPPVTLRAVSNYFRELDDLNQRHLIGKTVHLVPGMANVSGNEADVLFSYADELKGIVEAGRARPVDRMALGVALSMLKNYPEAAAVLKECVASAPDFTVAYMALANAVLLDKSAELNNERDGIPASAEIAAKRKYARLQEALSYYDKALELNPRLVYAWFNKGNIFYSIQDFTSAMQCYGEALKLDPSFGQAYYNRGLSYLQAGNKSQAFSDLSKAGELGVLPSYNLLKRMK